MRLRARTILLSIFLVLTAWGGTLWAADSAQTVETRVKVAYLYNFTRFVEWPPHAPSAKNNKVNICLLGDDPFGSALDSISGKSVGSGKLVVRRHQSVEDLSGCHVVYISSSEKSDLGDILNKLRKRPILSVGETKNFNKLGGVIRFTLVKKKVHFNIDLDAAKRARLTISSKLLNLANIVRESRP